MKKFLIISNANELLRLAPEKIVYISSDGNYSHFMLADSTTRMVTVQLGKISDLIEEQQIETPDLEFIRLGRSMIINKYYVTFINLQQQTLVLSDARNFSHTVKAPRDALKQIKSDLEKEISKEHCP